MTYKHRTKLHQDMSQREVYFATSTFKILTGPTPLYLADLPSLQEPSHNIALTVT